MQYESVPESLLFDVFSDIKGTGGKHRSYITLDDFTTACQKYSPASLSVLKTNFSSEEELYSFLFSNMCETITQRESQASDLSG